MAGKAYVPAILRDRRYVPWDFVRELYQKELEPRELLVLITLARYGHGRHWDIFPALSRVAHDSNYDLSSVKRIIAGLRKKGILRVEGRKRKGVKNYSIDFSAMNDKEPYRPAEAVDNGRGDDQHADEIPL